MPVNPDIIFILFYFQKKVYRQSEAEGAPSAFFERDNYLYILLEVK